MFIDIPYPDSIREINNEREEDGYYLLDVLFDDGHVMVYGFPDLKQFIRGYTEFMNKYRGG